MAGSKSNYLENKVLDHVLGGGDYSRPATVYIALFTARGTDAQADANTNWTEVSGGDYARKNVTNNVTNFPEALNGAKSNGAEIVFIEAAAPWGTVLAFGIYNAITGGDLLYWADLTTPKAIGSGDTAKFAVGGLSLTED